MKPRAGTVLGERYVLLAELGEAPGRVEYRALDRDVEVEVSLWWLAPGLFPDPDAVVGAAVELRGVRDLALRQCLGAGRRGDDVWVTWQLAPLGPARPPDDLRGWAAATARGLAALHGAGLVHGRLTPHDLVSLGGAWKLGGGGLWAHADARAADRAFAPWARYLAPELRRGAPPTEASDVYALAAIVAERAGAGDPTIAAALSPDPARRPPLAAVTVYDTVTGDGDTVVEGPPVTVYDTVTGAGALPTPAQRAIAGAVDRARTAPPGQYVVQAVSLKPGPPLTAPVTLPPPPAAPAMPDAPTGETPAIPRPKLRSVAEVAGRSFSVAPGQLGYLAPPKAVTDAEERRRWRGALVLALIALAAAAAGVAAALLL